MASEIKIETIKKYLFKHYNVDSETTNILIERIETAKSDMEWDGIWNIIKNKIDEGNKSILIDTLKIIKGYLFD